MKTLLVLAARLMGRRDAQDVAEEAFISLAKWIMNKPVSEAKAVLGSADGLRRFMFRIAACRAYDFWRERDRRQALTGDCEDIESAGVDTERSPQTVVEIARMERAYAALPPAQRVAHVLHYYYGFTDADFEATLGFTKTNSRTLVRRANLALKRAMEMTR